MNQPFAKNVKLDAKVIRRGFRRLGRRLDGVSRAMLQANIAFQDLTSALQNFARAYEAARQKRIKKERSANETDN